MDAIIENHAHKEFIEAAVKDGWEAQEGPWGYSESHERTVRLTKRFSSLEGQILLWMVDRNIGVQTFSKEASRWNITYPDNGWFTKAEAWLQLDSNGDRGLTVNLEEVLKNGLSEDYWYALSHTCDNCGKVVDHLNHVAFANKACDDCVRPMKAKMERHGWAD